MHLANACIGHYFSLVTSTTLESKLDVTQTGELVNWKQSSESDFTLLTRPIFFSFFCGREKLNIQFSCLIHE
jgi:hypothetical protein